MHMFMNKSERKFFLIILFVIFCSLYISCIERSDSIFEDMYKNILAEPVEYKNISDFSFEELYMDNENFPTYAKNYGCETIYRVTSDSIVITYWKVAGKNQIQSITIMGKKASHPFSRFVGKKSSSVIKQYLKNTVYEMTESELRYETEDRNNFIQFKIRNDIIYQIIIGKSL